jgi:hypothetical protein
MDGKVSTHISCSPIRRDMPKGFRAQYRYGILTSRQGVGTGPIQIAFNEYSRKLRAQLPTQSISKQDNSMSYSYSPTEGVD